MARCFTPRPADPQARASRDAATGGAPRTPPRPDRVAGRAAAAALEGIARNPGAADKLFVPMILGLALIESLVIYALIISFVLVFK